MSVEEAFQKKLSNVLLVTKGKVVEIIPDDRLGKPHQRFLIEPHPHHTLLVVNNLDLSYRIPEKIGDIIEVKGNYVWNRHGGLMHETHHHEEPGIHEDGYVNLIRKTQVTS